MGYDELDKGALHFYLNSTYHTIYTHFPSMYNIKINSFIINFTVIIISYESVHERFDSIFFLFTLKLKQITNRLWKETSIRKSPLPKPETPQVKPDLPPNKLTSPVLEIDRTAQTPKMGQTNLDNLVPKIEITAESRVSLILLLRCCKSQYQCMNYPRFFL
jgi:hypothetical protein